MANFQLLLQLKLDFVHDLPFVAQTPQSGVVSADSCQFRLRDDLLIS